MIVHTLKMCTSYFMHIPCFFVFFLFFFWGGGVLNLDIFSLEMLRWSLGCVILNPRVFFLNFQFLHNDCSYIEHVPLLFVEI